jgi:hypothetical protein
VISSFPSTTMIWIGGNTWLFDPYRSITARSEFQQFN